MDQSQLSAAEFREALTDQDVRVLQIIYAAIAVGLLAFLAVVVFVNRGGSEAGHAPNTSFLDLLTYIHFGFLVLMLISATLAYNLFLRSASVSAPPSPDLAAQTAMGRIRSASILRLALLEAAALLGLITCMVAAMSGALRLHPVYWINVASTFVVLVHVVLAFPSRDRIVRIYEEKLTT